MGNSQCQCVNTTEQEAKYEKYREFKAIKRKESEIDSEYMLICKIIRIQSAIRGYLERKKYERMKLEEYSENVELILNRFSRQ